MILKTVHSFPLPKNTDLPIVKAFHTFESPRRIISFWKHLDPNILSRDAFMNRDVVPRHVPSGSPY
jgi:hypothetical protein